MANTITQIPLKAGALGKIITLTEDTKVRVQGMQNEVVKYAATSEAISDLEIFVQNPKKGKHSEAMQELDVSNLKIMPLLPQQRGGFQQNSISFVKLVLLADKVDVKGAASLNDFKVQENSITDIKTNAGSKLEFVSKHVDYEKMLGDIRFVNAVAKEEYFDGQKTGEYEGYEVTVSSDKLNATFTFLVSDLETDYTQFRPLADLVEFVDPQISSLFEDVSSVERGGINISLKAETVLKKLSTAAKPEHAQSQKPQEKQPEQNPKSDKKP